MATSETATKKSMGLATFKAKGDEAKAVVPEESKRRERGKGDEAQFSVRMKREDWKRLHYIALDEGVSLQTLTLRGLDLLFKKMGQPGIEGV